MYLASLTQTAHIANSPKVYHRTESLCTKTHSRERTEGSKYEEDTETYSVALGGPSFKQTTNVVPFGNGPTGKGPTNLLMQKIAEEDDSDPGGKKASRSMKAIRRPSNVPLNRTMCTSRKAVK